MKLKTACLICGRKAKRAPLLEGVNACHAHYILVKERKEKEEQSKGGE